MMNQKWLVTIALIVAASYQVKAQNNTVKPERIYMDAVKAYITDKPAESQRLFEEYIKLEPQKPEGYYYLSGLYAEARRTTQAIAQIKKAIELDAGNKWYKERYATLLSINKQHKEAAKIYYELGTTEKLGEDYLMKAAMLYSADNDKTNAIKALDELQKKVGYDADLMVRKIQIYLKAKDYKMVEQLSQEMIDQDPKDSKNYSQLVDYYISRKEFDKAKLVLDKGIKVLPNDVLMQVTEAQYYQSVGDTAKFEQVLKGAITNTNLDAGTQISLLMPYLQQLGADSNKRQEGLALAAQLARQHPQNVDVLTFYGDLLMYEEQVDSAAEMYKKALKIDQSKFALWQQLLFAYTDKPKADSLIKYADEAALIFPNQAMVHYLQGIGKYNKSDNVSAIRSINRAIDLQNEDNKPLLSDMYSLLGDIHHAENNFKLSDENYTKALGLNPDNASVLNNYAYYLSLRKEKLEQAERMSKRSLELRPGEATFLDTYGWILFQQGKYEQAKKYIEDALKANPNADGTLYEHLGDILFNLGKTNEALSQWQLAKKKGVDNEKLLDKKIRDKKYYEQ